MGRLTFIGAAGVVTGSKHLLEADDGTRILLDCGLFQGDHLAQRNWTPPPLDPLGVQAVFLSHAHLDHCGYLPAFAKAGFGGRIFCTPATVEVAELVLKDSAALQEDEAARAKRHPERGLHSQPLYTNEDVDRLLPLFVPVGYEETRDDLACATLQLHDAGHILGSAIMEIVVDKRRLVYTGDLGRCGRPLLRDPVPLARADLVLSESTYGDRLHPAVDPREALCAAVDQAAQRGGVLVIPSFAVGRTQEILYALGQLQAQQRVHTRAVYVDSPMAITADAIMERHPEAMRFDLRERFGPADAFIGASNVSNVLTQDESIALNDLQSDAIIIASSGMATGGRVLHHLRNRLGRPNDTVCFVGFQPPGSLGHQLLSGQRKVLLFGAPTDVRATIVHIDGFSAHADRAELVRWFGNFQDKPKAKLVHGDPQAATSLAAALKEKLGLEASPARAGEVMQI